MGLGLALGGGAIALAIFMLRRKPVPPLPRADYASPGMQNNGLSGPQTFGTGGAPAPAYGQPAYGQPGAGQPAAGSGIGGKGMGGLATGLAVGAGVMAAQAIGKSLMGHDEHPAHPAANAGGNDLQPFARNDDMGGQNFGVNDAGSWDDGSSMASSDDGGDWDS